MHNAGEEAVGERSATYQRGWRQTCWGTLLTRAPFYVQEGNEYK